MLPACSTARCAVTPLAKYISRVLDGDVRDSLLNVIFTESREYMSNFVLRPSLLDQYQAFYAEVAVDLGGSGDVNSTSADNVSDIPLNLDH